MKTIIIGLVLATLAMDLRASDPELGQLPNGAYYLKHEIDFALTETAARGLSPAGPGRRPVAKAALTRMHRAIRDIVGGHTAAEKWLSGHELPERLRGRGPEVPRAARALKARLHPGEDAARVVEELRRHPDVAWASLNRVRSLALTPNDTGWPSQWGPLRVRADEAWDIPLVSNTRRIAIIDTGVDLGHPDLAARITYNRGFGGNGNGDAKRDMRGGNSIDHGTHVAGIAAAIRGNGMGIAGITRAEIMAMGCASWNSKTSQYGVCCAADAINDAVANGAEVINCSFGNDELTSAEEDALDWAKDEGVIVVVAAGNNSMNVDSSPSQGWNDHTWPLIVSNTQNDDMLSPSSNFGVAINLGAPGTSILSTVTTNFAMPSPNGQYGTMSGTSMASPLVAGGAAMVLGMNPSRVGAIGTKDVLYRMAQDLGPAGEDNSYGYGLLQLDPAFLRPLRGADAFLNPHTALPSLFQTGNYVAPYESIPLALSKLPAGSTLVLNGDITNPGTVFAYPPITLTKACTLKAFPDRRVLIGKQP